MNLTIKYLLQNNNPVSRAYQHPIDWDNLTDLKPTETHNEQRFDDIGLNIATETSPICITLTFSITTSDTSDAIEAISGIFSTQKILTIPFKGDDYILTNTYVSKLHYPEVSLDSTMTYILDLKADSIMIQERKQHDNDR